MEQRKNLSIADIIIVSALPKNPAIREARIKYHLRQRKELSLLFKWPYRIISFCSGWSDKELTKIEKQDTYAAGGQLPKYRKHNRILGDLYGSPRLRSMLFLDDDVVPRTPKETDPENGIVNTVTLVKHWLDNPEQMPGHVCFFAAQGLMFDAYYKSNPVILGPATPQVVGWAMMVRSDCDVLWDGKLMKFVTGRRYTSDDTAFRLHCEDQGKIVLKHNRAFFKTFQPKADTTSTYANGQEDRRPIIKADMALLRSMYPNIFSPKKKAKQSAMPEGGGLFGQKHD